MTYARGLYLVNPNPLSRKRTTEITVALSCCYNTRTLFTHRSPMQKKSPGRSSYTSQTPIWPNTSLVYHRVLPKTARRDVIIRHTNGRRRAIPLAYIVAGKSEFLSGKKNGNDILDETSHFYLNANV